MGTGFALLCLPGSNCLCALENHLANPQNPCLKASIANTEQENKAIAAHASGIEPRVCFLRLGSKASWTHCDPRPTIPLGLVRLYARTTGSHVLGNTTASQAHTGGHHMPSNLRFMASKTSNAPTNHHWPAHLALLLHNHFGMD